jgi:glycosyltransferase involved in cell wall biosynthesis
MKVLFCLRHNFNSSPGGAQIQILKTKEYLEKLNITCDITVSPYGVDYNKYDILHLTDLTWVYDNMLYLEEIKKNNFKGKKVLSTIYWPFDDYALNGAPFIQKQIFKIFGINGFEFAKTLGKYMLKRKKVYLKGLKSKYIENQRKIVMAVDWFLPNAETEMQALNDRLVLNNTNYSVVNNAIDTKLFDEVLKKNSISKDNSLITFVARIDPRKNQLRFLKAMMDTEYKIRFIGNPGPNSRSYLKKLKQLAETRGNVEFISHLTQREVFEHMLEAKLNVLTSWVETPGLVSLEAVYAKCNILVSKKGSVVDYFRDYAFYCAPDNIEEIKSQTIKAMNCDFKEPFRDLIKSDYSWEVTANQTLYAYKKVLNE